MASNRDPADRRFRQFCATGDPDALGDVFDHTAGRLLRVALWLAGNRPDAEDLVQRTFLEAIETRAQFRAGAPVLPWLMGLLGNQARRQRRERDRAAAARPAPDRVVDPEAAVVARELADSVRSVGERLGAPYGEVLRLHLEAGFNCQEIAARLERRPGTVRTQLARALDLLRQRLPAGFATGAVGFAIPGPGALDGARAKVVAAARDAMPTSASAAWDAARPFGGIPMIKTALLAIPVLAVLGGTAAYLVHKPGEAPAPAPAPAVTARNDLPPPSTDGADERDPARVAPSDAAPRLAAIELPRLSVLGAVAAGDPDDGPPLEIDRNTPWRAVTGQLFDLRAAGRKRVRFLAELPSGQTGCFTLALPAGAGAVAALELRLHRERAGVPPENLTPVLGRIVRGRRELLEQESKGAGESAQKELAERFPEPFTVAVTAPGDAPFEQVLRVLAAASRSGVQSVVLASADDADGEGTYAIDLGPCPRIAIAPRPQLLPAQPIAVTDGVVGCPLPPATAVPPRAMLGAGGRYGGRGQQPPKDPLVWSPTDGIGAGFSWLATAQQPDGSFLDDGGRPDLEATALVALALLATNTSPYSGENSEMLGKALGWILDGQRDDGALAAGGRDSLRHHALATLVLAEAYGLAYFLELRGGLVDALVWLRAQRGDDGGFGDGLPGSPSDPVSTAAAVVALATAEFFAVEPTGASGEALHWFDGREPADDATAAAAELFARFFGTGNPRTSEDQVAVADRLLTAADPADPWSLYWATSCQFQMGGARWKSWSDRLAEVARRQVTDGTLAGSWPPAYCCSRASTTALTMLSLATSSRYTRIIR